MADAMRYVRLPGKREGETVLVDREDGYIWHTHSQRRLKCSRYRTEYCPATLSSHPENTYETNGIHNHRDDHQAIKNMEMENWCKAEARVRSTSLHEIFVEGAQMFPLATVDFHHFSRTLQRVRGSVRPIIPRDPDHAHNLIEGSPFYRNMRDGRHQFYFGRVVMTNESALIFINEEALPALVNTEEVSMDGTFRTLPRMFMQLASVHVMSYGISIPVAFFIMTSKSQELYTLCLNRLLEVCREKEGQDPAPLRLVSDFELAILQSLQECFPTGRARGCWYHYTAAVYRYACGLGLAIPYRTNANVKAVIRMSFSLALLPANRAQEGYNEICAFIRRINAGLNLETQIAIARFQTYLRTFWFERVGSMRFCVGVDVNRTNNFIESWHRRLNEIMRGVHLNIWDFISKLQTLAYLAVRNFMAARQGRRIRTQRRHLVIRDNRISEAIQKLLQRRINIVEFLEMTSHLYEPLEEIVDELNLPIQREDAELLGPFARAIFEILMPFGDNVNHQPVIDEPVVGVEANHQLNVDQPIIGDHANHLPMNNLHIPGEPLIVENAAQHAENLLMPPRENPLFLIVDDNQQNIENVDYPNPVDVNPVVRRGRGRPRGPRRVGGGRGRGIGNVAGLNDHGRIDENHARGFRARGHPRGQGRPRGRGQGRLRGRGRAVAVGHRNINLEEEPQQNVPFQPQILEDEFEHQRIPEHMDIWPFDEDDHMLRDWEPVVADRQEMIQRAVVRDLCCICLEEEANWGIDCCNHQFCQLCIQELRVPRVGLGYILRPNVCALCRSVFVLSFPLLA